MYNKKLKKKHVKLPICIINTYAINAKTPRMAMSRRAMARVARRARMAMTARVVLLNRMVKDVEREIEELEAMESTIKLIMRRLADEKSEDKKTDDEKAEDKIAEKCIEFVGLDRIADAINTKWVFKILPKKLADLRLELAEWKEEILQIEMSTEMTRLWSMGDMNGMNLLKRCFEKKNLIL